MHRTLTNQNRYDVVSTNQMPFQRIKLYAFLRSPAVGYVVFDQTRSQSLLICYCEDRTSLDAMRSRQILFRSDWERVWFSTVS